MAFATAEGGIGVIHGETVELLGEACEPPAGIAGRDAPAVVALAPLEPGAMVAVCHAGAVLAIAERTPRAGGRFEPPPRLKRRWRADEYAYSPSRKPRRT